MEEQSDRPPIAEKDELPSVGTYWTEGALRTSRDLMLESYSTCARCGAFVNTSDRHDDWHRLIERVL